MSDVSNIVVPLMAPITPTPIYKLENDAVKALISKHGHKIKTNGDLIYKAIYEEDTLADIYKEVGEKYDYREIEKFKKRLSRNITCFNLVIRSVTPGNIKKEHHTCGSKGCFGACLPYKSNANVHYHKNIVRFGVVMDYRQGEILTNQIEKELMDAQWDEFTVKMTPSHDYDGRNYIRLSCLRLDRLNPLEPDNETKQRLEMFDELFPGFESVTKISADDNMVSVYVTSTHSIQFSSADLYVTRPSGQGGAREIGTKPGYEFNSDIGKVEYTSVKERKKKEDKEKGIIGKKPTLNINLHANEEKLEKAYKKAATEMSEHPERMVFSTSGSPEDALNINFIFSKKVVDELNNQFEPQPYMPMSNRLTQDDLDSFNSVHAIPYVQVGENILEVEFTDEMLGIGRKVYGLKDRYQVVQNQGRKKAQDVILKAPTIDEFVDNLMAKVRKFKGK